MTFQPDDTIDGKYRIVGLLGEGGMGAVYEGENTRIHRRVAIKVLHSAVAAKADVVQRFEREAQAAGRIGSEHIVEVLDLGTAPDGERYMVMEFLEGESLGERIRRRQRLSPQEIAPILHEILEGLDAAHGAGIVHRDLKPDNVFLLRSRAGRRDFVKILDFGVSKFAALESELSMTKSGAVMGTPFYMSPEQARGQDVDGRSDLYSVGVVAYQAVTGRVPFHAATFNELVFKIALESPEPAELHTPGLDKRFSALIARAMVRDPGGRFQSARDFQTALAAWAAQAGAPLSSSSAGAPPVAGVTGGIPSIAELGLAKTVAPGDEIEPAADSAPARRRRRLTLGVALLAILAGGLAAYGLVGAPAHPVTTAPPVVAASPPAVETATPRGTVAAVPVPSVAPVEAPSAGAATTTPSVAATAEPASGHAPRGKASAAPKASAHAPTAPTAPLVPVAPTAAPVVPNGRAIGSEL